MGDSMTISAAFLRRMDDEAFRIFARQHPHEAAEVDFSRFCELVRTVNPKMSDAEIRKVLEETGG